MMKNQYLTKHKVFITGSGSYLSEIHLKPLKCQILIIKTLHVIKL